MFAPIDHIILFGGLFLIFFFITRTGQKKLDINFWKVLLFPIIAYTLIVGLRYGWGVDYEGYQETYETMSFYEGYDFGYGGIQSLLHFLGLHKFWMASLVYAFLFIIAVMLVIKNVGGSSKYMIMLFLPATVMAGNTYAIRQYLAITFVLFAFYCFSQERNSKRVRKYVLAILLIFISFTIHAGSLAFSIPLAVMFFVFKKPLSTNIAVIIYLSVILFTSFFQNYIEAFLDKYLGFIVVTEHLQDYVTNFSSILEDDKAEMLGHSGIFLLFEYISRLIIIIISGWALSIKENKIVGVFYNFMLFGMCLQHLYFTSEIFRRITDPIYTFYFIPVGYALYVLFSEKKSILNTQRRTGLQLMSGILLLYIYYPVYKFLLFFKLAGFIWNQ